MTLLSFAVFHDVVIFLLCGNIGPSVDLSPAQCRVLKRRYIGRYPYSAIKNYGRW